jgi:hypothetical protein
MNTEKVPVCPVLGTKKDCKRKYTIMRQACISKAKKSLNYKACVIQTHKATNERIGVFSEGSEEVSDPKSNDCRLQR